MAPVIRERDKSSSPCNTSYHVFLSFRGQDTRETFTDHLYTALVGAGFRTFRDDEELPRGEKIKLELDKAITESSSAIIVLSQDYASSRWCLDELVKILEHRKISKNHLVLPIFYHVDPSDIRNQRGSVAEAFAVHEDRCKAETDGERRKGSMEEIKRWRLALKEVADLAGMTIQNRPYWYESKFIHKVIKVVGDKLKRTILNVPPYVVGIDFQAKDITSWLNDGSSDVGIMAICGIGGIGKTTLAKHIFNLNFGNFDGSCFLFNIRETSQQHNGLVRLQEQLLSDILKGRKHQFSSVDEGFIKIKDALGCKRVLIVLDDVDNLAQLDALIATRDWFYPGSKIIITTRHVRLLPNNKNSKIHNIRLLDVIESIRLFNYYAFGQGRSSEVYNEQVRNVVDRCAGLPLALQVMGSCLNGQSVDVWKSALMKLESVAVSDVVRKLKISYDNLQDDHDQRLFLEIACFFIQEDKDQTVTILDKCDYYTVVGIQNLVDRCLLTVGEDNRLMMHQLVRDMAREIVRLESPNDPGRRSRLWDHKDSTYVLKEDTGTEAIEGIVLKGQTLNTRPSFDLNSENPRKQRFLGLFSGNMVKNNAFSYLDEVEFETKAFARMRRLRLLQISYCRLEGGYKKFPEKLRWLYWRGFPLESIPNDFPLERLVSLSMSYSRLKQVCKGYKVLRCLKILDLSHSCWLTRTPDFSRLPNLERLILENCVSLVEVHSSIGNLENTLVLLNLKGCQNLRKLPTDISMLKVLETLIISGCSNLDELPDVTRMKSLKVFSADGVTVNSIISTSEEDFCHWSAISWMPKSRKNPKLHLPHSLVKLSLEGCNLYDETFAKELGNMHSLRSVSLKNNPICCLPDFIKGFSRLDCLELSSCKRLESLIGLPSVDRLVVQSCPLLEKLTFQPGSFLPEFCDIMHSKSIVSIEGVFNLEPLENIEEEVLQLLGWYDLEPIKTIQMEWYTPAINLVKTGPIQGLYEVGNFNIFYPGSQVPIWFSIKLAGSSLSFTMPSSPNLQFQVLNVCYVYTINRRLWKPLSDSLYIGIINETKGQMFFYFPQSFALPKANEDMVWLSHLIFQNNELEQGDLVTVTSFFTEKDLYMIKEIGISTLYGEQQCEEGIQKSFDYISANPLRNVRVERAGRRYEPFLLCPSFFHFTEVLNKIFIMAVQRQI